VQARDKARPRWAHATEQCVGKVRFRCGEPWAAEFGELDEISYM
jgi:hypothetical protein